MGKTSLTQEMIDEIVSLYSNEKYSINKLKKIYNLSSKTITNCLVDEGVHIRTISETKQKITPEVEASFIEMYTVEKKSTTEIAKICGVGASTVMTYLRKNNIKLRGNGIPLETQSLIVHLYEDGYSEGEIENETGVCRITVRKILRKNNVRIREKYEYRVYTLDENYFDLIDTQNKAYVLGLFYADGNVSKEKYNIQLSLQECDKHILEQISEDMNSNAPLCFRNFEKYGRNQQNHYSLSLHSKVMHEALSRWGIVPQKTHALTYPIFLSPEMHRHFIRGVLDGDGCIHIPYGKNGKIRSVSICGTYDFCLGFKDVIEQKLNIHCSVIKNRKDPKSTTYKTVISGKIQVYKFLSWIYEDANLYLYRKHDIYQKYYNQEIA